MAGASRQRSVTRIGVDADGVPISTRWRAALAAHDTAEGLPLVAIHAANNETGVIQPIAEIAAIVKAAGGVLVVDAVQAAGRIPIDMSAGYADYLILSSHKIGGPKGAGAIVAAADLMMPKPLVNGGGQEKGHRGGTENLAAIAGFGAAARRGAGRTCRHRRGARRRDEIEAIMHDAGAGCGNLRNRRADGLPIRHSSLFRASRPRRRRSPSIWPAWRCRPARPVRRARSVRAMC